MTKLSRRKFNKALLAYAAAIATPLSAAASLAGSAKSSEEVFRLALMTWSFHLQLWKGELKAVDVPRLAKSLEVDTLEWAAKTFHNLSGGR